VFNAALYRYATTGEASGAFSVEDMNASFRPRRGARGVTPGGSSGGAISSGPTMPTSPSNGEPNRPDL
jgi:hypothetical protein